MTMLRSSVELVILFPDSDPPPRMTLALLPDSDLPPSMNHRQLQSLFVAMEDPSYASRRAKTNLKDEAVSHQGGSGSTGLGRLIRLRTTMISGIQTTQPPRDKSAKNSFCPQRNVSLLWIMSPFWRTSCAYK
jgi:hypothetical protein